MTTQSLQTTLNINLPIGNLDAYISYVNQIPMLTQDEETALAYRLHQFNDLKAAKHLVLSHARYVVKIAKGYLGYGLPLSDLIQEGNIGLMKAVKRFDPKVGARLVTFAAQWVKSEIHEFILKNWRIVKIATTKAQRKLFFNLRSSKKRLGWFTNDEMNEVAQDLKVKPETVREMELRLSSTDTSFDAHDSDEDENSLIPANYLADPSANPAQALEATNWLEHSNVNLQDAIRKLDERSQDILYARWLDEEKRTLQELADKYQVSAERIRQLEKNAMQKLKAVLEEE